MDQQENLICKGSMWGMHWLVWFLKGTSKISQSNQTQALRCIYGSTSQWCTNSVGGLDGGLMGTHVPLNHASVCSGGEV